MQLERIVVGVDFSEPSVAAAQWVARVLAPEAEVVLAHVIDIPPTLGVLHGSESTEVLEDVAQEGARRRLSALANTLGGARVVVEVRTGRPSECLAEVATGYRAGLVVVGTHRRRQGLRDRLGTTAERLLGASPVPVLLASHVPDHRPRHVLVPVDGSDITSDVLAWGRTVAERFDARATGILVVASAVSSHLLLPDAAPAFEDADGRDPVPVAGGVAHNPLAERMLAAGFDPSSADDEVAFGEPGQEILAAAARHESDMIVMGRRGVGGLRRALLGSVTSEVLRGSTCPVLVVDERPPGA